MNEKHDTHVSFTAAELAASPDGRCVVVASADGRMRLFSMHGSLLTLLRILDVAATDTFFVPCCIWHPAGAHILAADGSGTIQVCLLVCNSSGWSIFGHDLVT
jgi:WD40 repeat protein